MLRLKIVVVIEISVLLRHDAEIAMAVAVHGLLPQRPALMRSVQCRCGRQIAAIREGTTTTSRSDDANPLQSQKSLGRFIQSIHRLKDATASTRTRTVSASLNLFFIPASHFLQPIRCGGPAKSEVPKNQSLPKANFCIARTNECCSRNRPVVPVYNLAAT
jgi:hypothetical protein